MTEWIIKNQGADAREIEVRGKKIPRVIVQILNNRGYDTPDKIENFFAPTLDGFHDPFLMPGMERAVERIIRACRTGERILLHGDYDTDGITAVALLSRNLKKLGAAPETFLPNRFQQGYGLSRDGIDLAAQKGCTLIITADCGITAVEEVAYARQKKIDIIVCDHHQPGPDLPAASALVDPKLDGGGYPFQELAGVGVAFKVLQAVYQRMGSSSEDLFDDLDLVALGTVVDVVPLTGENRLIVKQGLKKINCASKAGIKALIADSRLARGVTSYHLGFVIGPRLNACGRLRDAQEALELLLTGDHARARELARRLELDNQERQEIQEAIYDQAHAMIEERRLALNRVIVIGHEQWHEGVIGIVASRLAEEYCRPSILLVVKKDLAKGSCRSVPGFDITAALSSCGELLTKYGGHRQAAGLELDPDRIGEFDRRINAYALKFGSELFIKRRFYDLQLDLTEITEDVVFFLKYFEPTGVENPQPVFRSAGCEVVGVPRVVGSDHLKFALRMQDRIVDAVAFRQAANILEIKPGRTRVDCLYSITEDSFTGKRKVVLKIKDMSLVQDGP